MKLSRLLLLAATAFGLAIGAASAADKKLQFAVVPKAMNNPYFDLSRDGCMARAKELGNVECIYRGPIEHEPASQVQIIQDLITQGVDGLAISVSDAEAAVGVIKQARDAGIAVITFDADSPSSARQAYVGTDNKAMGAELGKQLIKVHPTPGIYITQSGGPAAQNLNERLEGLNSTLQAAGWKIAPGSPSYCNDDSALANQQLADMYAANPNASAIVPVGGWALFAPEAYKSFVNGHKQAYDSGKLALVMPDTLKVEVELLRDGYAQVLVGQRPAEMGAKAMDMLLALKKGEKVPVINYVGLDVVTKDNTAQFLK
ncbi:MAG TPA: sugar-binding protein [Acetobacteraceae bacterium]|jgi:ribose transport system substrate-binding protein|nr:sugar-binding protein [Acetobacteraceae bacterium]